MLHVWKLSGWILGGALVGGFASAAEAIPSTAAASTTRPAVESSGGVVVRPAWNAEYDTLVEEFGAAVESWTELYREARGLRARNELKDQHPAHGFWAKFEALAEAGEGRALLWMADNLRDKGLKVQAARDERARLYKLVVDKYLGEEWFGELLAALPRNRRAFTPEWEEGTYRKVMEGSPHRRVQALAMDQLSELLSRDEGQKAQQESEQLLLKLAAEYRDTPQGANAGGLLYERKYLATGKVAPDFDGKTIDGHDFKLSDYRGKVVLVDFYGFW